jgi:uncharacterized protein
MLDIQVAGLALQVCPQRALYWPQQRCLLVADVHLGKADTFRQYGIGVPQGLQHDDLARLKSVLALTNPRRCVVLGDLVHGRILGEETVQAWNALVHSQPSTQFELVVGNHDQALPADVLSLHAIYPCLELAGVWFSHEPLPRQQVLQSKGRLNIHGHLHAAVQLPGSRSKMPALVYQAPHLCLPAFSAFSAGVVLPGAKQGLWVFEPEGGTVVSLIGK